MFEYNELAHLLSQPLQLFVLRGSSRGSQNPQSSQSSWDMQQRCQEGQRIPHQVVMGCYRHSTYIRCLCRNLIGPSMYVQRESSEGSQSRLDRRQQRHQERSQKADPTYTRKPWDSTTSISTATYSLQAAAQPGGRVGQRKGGDALPSLQTRASSSGVLAEREIGNRCNPLFPPPSPGLPSRPSLSNAQISNSSCEFAPRGPADRLCTGGRLRTGCPKRYC